MPDGSDSPTPTEMRRRFRPRLTLLWLMVIVAAIAILLAWERKRRVAILMADYQRAQDRFDWAVRMNRRGYVSQAVLHSEQVARDQLHSQLQWFGAAPAQP